MVLLVRNVLLSAALATLAAFPASGDDAIKTHWDVRSAIYNMHRSIAGPDATVLVGDSITEGFWWDHVGSCPVVNAGFGGINAENMTVYLPVLLQGGAPTFAVILIGANDTGILPGQSEFTDAQAASFKMRYGQIVDTFKGAGSTVITVSIPPIEPQKFRGIKRSPEAIERLNRIIRDEIAAPRGLEYEDLNAALSENGAVIPDTTTDGIHLGKAAYGVLYRMLDQALQRQVAKTGKAC